jgi:hypothetical protein
MASSSPTCFPAVSRKPVKQGNSDVIINMRLIITGYADIFIP